MAPVFNVQANGWRGAAVAASLAILMAAELGCAGAAESPIAAAGKQESDNRFLAAIAERRERDLPACMAACRISKKQCDAYEKASPSCAVNDICLEELQTCQTHCWEPSQPAS